MKIAVAQLNPIIADFGGQWLKIKSSVEFAVENGADCLIFPELFVCGYPPRDFLLRHDFLTECDALLHRCLELTKQFPNLGLIIGHPTTHSGKGKGLYNSCSLIESGQIVFTQHKSCLPFYDIFDENRYFDAAPSIGVVQYKGETLALTICEDLWNDDELAPDYYHHHPLKSACEKGATLAINIMASPFQLMKSELRESIFKKQSKNFSIPIVAVNQVGGNDELVFDGGSFMTNANGEIVFRAAAFESSVTIVDTQKNNVISPIQSDMESLWSALVCGLKDYAKKCGFKTAILGLSGGIDSAVTACIARYALGPENVYTVAMPTRYSSQSSLDDAEALATNLNLNYEVASIDSLFDDFLETLSQMFRGKAEDLTEENLQSRIRGTTLMALSNKFGHLMLSTGNKSELSVGYCTIYGDMNGGLNVLADVPKTTVYDLARYINSTFNQVIPESTITKPPSAELRLAQKDSDSLPDYDVLDDIIDRYIVQQQTEEDIVQAGHSQKEVKRILNLIAHNEYKRRQAPPGIKVTSKAFGTGRRFPIAAKFSSLETVSQTNLI